MRLYSDERCIFQEGRVVPFLRRLTLRAGGRAALLEDEPANSAFTDLLRSWATYDEVAVRASRLFEGASQGGAPLPLRWLFLIDGYGDVPALTPTTALAAAPALLRSLSRGDSTLDRMAGLLRELQGVGVYRLRLGRPAASAHVIKDVMERDESAALL